MLVLKVHQRQGGLKDEKWPTVVDKNLVQWHFFLHYALYTV